MLLYALPFVKVAVTGGAASGVADTLYQYVRKTKFTKRKGKKSSWDAERTAKVAMGATVMGPLLAFPAMAMGTVGFSNAAGIVAALAITEGMAGVPFYKAYTDERVLGSFKAQLPLLVSIAGLGTLAATSAMALSVGHVSVWTNPEMAAAFFPESVVFTFGMGCTSFLYYCFVHQACLTLQTDMPKKMNPTIRTARWLGQISAASLMAMTLMPVTTNPFMHAMAQNGFFLGGTGFQCLTTYALAHSNTTRQSNQNQRVLCNATFLTGALLSSTFAQTGHLGVATGLQVMSGASWIAYFVACRSEFEGLAGRSFDVSSGSESEEELPRGARKNKKKLMKKKKAAGLLGGTSDSDSDVPKPELNLKPAIKKVPKESESDGSGAEGPSAEPKAKAVDSEDENDNDGFQDWQFGKPKRAAKAAVAARSDDDESEVVVGAKAISKKKSEEAGKKEDATPVAGAIDYSQYLKKKKAAQEDSSSPLAGTNGGAKAAQEDSSSPLAGTNGGAKATPSSVSVPPPSMSIESDNDDNAIAPQREDDDTVATPARSAPKVSPRAACEEENGDAVPASQKPQQPKKKKYASLV
eukprot:NODE_1135_length_1874_cov_18.486008_g1076_i0.p1 GENE.NODE_1135_length_1874_cov_18.486008_g1076_i0~~NODE_1135_length_1874_cov_18.486008_g1076_i0.p1  ORF type:complete len:581 (+),score=131.55 NODE_1135_length_1874_cov_18.486008_g1076_i0:85-1827(+)